MMWPKDTTIKLHKFSRMVEVNFTGGSEYPRVCSTEFNCMRTDFPDHFKAGAVPISRTNMLVLWDELDEHMREIQTDNPGIDLGVKFHYGLAAGAGGVYNMQIAAQAVSLDERAKDMYYDVTDLESRVHPIDDTGSLGDMALTTWNNGAKAVYFDRVIARCTNDNEWDELVKGTDAEAYLLP